MIFATKMVNNKVFFFIFGYLLSDFCRKLINLYMLETTSLDKGGGTRLTARSEKTASIHGLIEVFN